MFSNPSPTAEENEQGARDCESFLEEYPVLFPKEPIIRKMFVVSMVMPKFIRDQKMVHKFLTLEQEGERLHKQLDYMERMYKSVQDKAERYFLMKKEHENKLNQE